jgi:hypothetical protein
LLADYVAGETHRSFELDLYAGAELADTNEKKRVFALQEFEVKPQRHRANDVEILWQVQSKARRALGTVKPADVSDVGLPGISDRDPASN